MILTHLRHDLPEVRQSGDYFEDLLITELSSNAQGKDYTMASLLLHIEPCVWENMLGEHDPPCGLLQGGLLATSSDVRWFAFSHLPIECLRGTAVWFTKDVEERVLGCLGNPGDIVSLNSFHRVRINNEGNGYWVISIHEPETEENDQPIGHPVARIKSDSNEIIYAASIFAE
jgi:hypothetical protein